MATEPPEDIFQMEQILLILLGWLLGLLSPIIFDLYRSQRQKQDFVKAAVLELRDIQFTAACSAFLLEMRHGRITTELVALVDRVVDEYRGNEPIEVMPDVLKALTEKTQDEIDALVATRQRQPTVGSSIKTVDPVYLNQNINLISNLDETNNCLFMSY